MQDPLCTEAVCHNERAGYISLVAKFGRWRCGSKAMPPDVDLCMHMAMHDFAVDLYMCIVQYAFHQHFILTEVLTYSDCTARTILLWFSR